MERIACTGQLVKKSREEGDGWGRRYERERGRESKVE